MCFRLVLMVLASVVCYLVAYFVPQGVATVCLVAGCGYVLSTDLSGFGRQLLQLCCHSNRNDHPRTPDGFLWRWSHKEVAFHLCMTVLVSVIAGAVNYARPDISQYLAYVTMALLLLQFLLSQLQMVYICAGTLRNPLYPDSAQRSTIFHQRKSRLNVLGYIHRALVDAGMKTTIVCTSMILMV